MKEIMAELTGESAVLSLNLRLLSVFRFSIKLDNLYGSPVFYLQAEEEVLLRAKEALCTCTLKTSMEEMELLERRYFNRLLAI